MFCSFLGLGQAGGNICEEASKRGFYTGVINYSQKDLDSLENVQLKLKLIGSEGVGKRREEAIKLMDNNWDLALNFVKDHFSHPTIEIIFVPFSTGGGSGSGIAPVLLNLLTETMTDKVFVAMPIIPDETEVLANQRNCIETFEDLSNLSICILPIDNNQIRANSIQVSKDKIYNTVNSKVINLITNVINYTEQQSKYSVFDKKDLLAVFTTKGFATIAETNLTSLINKVELSEISFSDKIQESWGHSPFVKIELEQIITAAILFDGQEKIMEFLNINKIFSVFKNKMPIHLFEGYYNNNNGKLISILSGLSLCKSRLESIERIITENQDNLVSIQQIPIAYKSKVSSLTFNQSRTQPKKKPSINDISDLINKFKR